MLAGDHVNLVAQGRQRVGQPGRVVAYAALHGRVLAGEQADLHRASIAHAGQDVNGRGKDGHHAETRRRTRYDSHTEAQRRREERRQGPHRGTEPQRGTRERTEGRCRGGRCGRPLVRGTEHGNTPHAGGAGGTRSESLVNRRGARGVGAHGSAALPGNGPPRDSRPRAISWPSLPPRPSRSIPPRREPRRWQC